MKIYTDLENFEVKNPVLTIGTFDGVHLGHHKVIEKLKKRAQDLNGESVIFTFYPHPRLIIDPENTGNLRLINTLEEKKELLEKSGIDHLVIFPFTIEFSKLPYFEFVKKILVEKLNIKHLIIGYDHKFGHNREGGFEDLVILSKKYDFNIERLEALNMDAINISSTKVRMAIEDGDIETANKYLGYKYFIKGDVVDGKKLGRKIGFPTANIIPQESYKLIPKDGVYAVNIMIDGEIFNGMLNIGIRPTVNNQTDIRTIEVNIFDFDKDIYYQNINIIFNKRIRDERLFDGIDKLIEQLHKDKKTCKKILEK